MQSIKLIIGSVTILLLLSPHTTSALGKKDKYQKGYYLDTAHHQINGFISVDDADCLSFLFKK
ncbi:hypothetical protein CLV51_104349 [Chitinophaga niastensis]|uniref:Uncharacterized protein n=1 Tax=Chitinophaga niastensis TaxID=536980 RepID=A0A2P8HHF2_CHINA|nr:hypothetical protein [Chitinophaga niastensis]PSL45643.1 hypothetical protein CLV51_104349 [Chitinophaga niastensis]